VRRGMRQAGQAEEKSLNFEAPNRTTELTDRGDQKQGAADKAAHKRRKVALA
jgi:hypothetical protein